jgi:hypothetical protein
MATTTVSPEVKKPAGIPKTGMNPGVAPNLVCQNRGCHRILEPLSAKDNPSTGQLEVVYHCDNCDYDFHMSPQYAHGDYSASGKKKKVLPEIFQKSDK